MIREKNDSWESFYLPLFVYSILYLAENQWVEIVLRQSKQPSVIRKHLFAWQRVYYSHLFLNLFKLLYSFLFFFGHLLLLLICLSRFTTLYLFLFLPKDLSLGFLQLWLFLNDWNSTFAILLFFRWKVYQDDYRRYYHQYEDQKSHYAKNTLTVLLCWFLFLHNLLRLDLFSFFWHNCFVSYDWLYLFLVLSIYDYCFFLNLFFILVLRFIHLFFLYWDIYVLKHNSRLFERILWLTHVLWLKLHGCYA